MVEIKGVGPGVAGVGTAKATRKSSQAQATGGASFADLLDQAGGTQEAAPAAPNLPNLPYAPVPGSYDDNATSRQKANHLMESLTALADDALAGASYSGGAARSLADLQAALNANPPDAGSLSEPQQQAMDELATRAAVEVAKRGG